MLAQTNEYIKDASTTIFQLSNEEAIRMQCEAREEFYRRQRTMQKYFEMSEEKNVALEKENSDLKAENNDLKAELAKERANRARLEAALAKQNS